MRAKGVKKSADEKPNLTSAQRQTCFLREVSWRLNPFVELREQQIKWKEVSNSSFMLLTAPEQ